MNEEASRKPVIGPIRDRSRLRVFAPEHPTEGELASLITAASLAPSAGNGQPWRFVRCVRGTPSFRSLVSALRASNAWAAEAPVLIATAVRTVHVHPTKPPKENRLALLELGLATGNLLAQATALGLIARPLGGFDRDAVRAALEIPGDWALGVLVAVGRPSESEGTESTAGPTEDGHRERLDPGDLLFDERWGRAPSGRSAARSEPGPDEPDRER